MRKRVVTFLLACLMMCAEGVYSEVKDVIDLSGKWTFRIDPEDRGIGEKWFNQILDDSITLPGSLQEQGYGNDVSVETQWTGAIIDKSWYTEEKYAPYRQPGNIRVPFWLTPDKHYVGAAWYQKELVIPENWEDKQIMLELERCHWLSTVWLDDQLIGEDNSLSTAHFYQLPDKLKPGKHRITIRIDNRLQTEVGINAHSVSDHTQTNWNGVVGDIRLQAMPTVHLDDVQVFPEVRTNTATVSLVVNNQTGTETSVAIVLKAAEKKPLNGTVFPEIKTTFDLQTGENRYDLSYPMGDEVAYWDEFNPVLYNMYVRVESEGAPALSGERSITFGMREIVTDGTHIKINGRTVFLRGTLECAIFPQTGYPPTDVSSWERIISICKAHGLNHIRFHSWCPPEAAFIAADELGFYFQVECGAWAKIGDGDPIDQWIYNEGDRILQAYGNHPSFILMAYGNEPGGKNQKAYLGALVDYWKEKDARRLYTGGAGWPLIPENDFHNTPNPRIQGWGAGLSSRINSRPPETETDYRDYINKQNIPVVSHEIGQWCVYPNFEEIDKYTGVLKAGNFEIFRNDLEKNHMLDQAHGFLMASGKLQALCYKEEIESALRTPAMGGFQLLDLHDFPGQGTALVGVLDPFWDEKGYISAEEYHRFSCETVPLARMEKRIWMNNEPFQAKIEIAHYGPRDLDVEAIQWKIQNRDGHVLKDGRLKIDGIQTGMINNGGVLLFDLGTIEEAVALNLEVLIPGTEYVNDWDFWVYPSRLSDPELDGIHLAKKWDAETISILNNGGTVLFIPPAAQIKGDGYGPVPAGFSSIFWNTAWTNRQPPHTLGILCDPGHPVFAQFPTDHHSNWQWWELVTQAHPFILNEMPAELRPLVQLIDDWFTNRRLGLVFEAKVGRGRLLACGIDIETNLDNRPVARQLRASLINYIKDTQFNPEIELEPGKIETLMARLLLNKGLGASIRLRHACSPEYRGGGEKGLLDGVLGSLTYSDGRWKGFEGADFHAVIDLKEEKQLESVYMRFLRNQNSWIFFPEKVVISVSGNERDYIIIHEEKLGKPEENSQISIYKSGVNWRGKARYIKIEARNTAECPEWHPGYGGKAWLFTDEIIIQ